MRTVMFWLWFVIAVMSVGRLWTTLQAGVLTHAGVADGLALASLAVALYVLGRVQARAARVGRR